MKNWNYARLSQTAKSFGGPEQMLSALKRTYSFRGAAIGVGIAVGAFGTYKLIKRLLLSKKIVLNGQEVKETEKTIVLGINSFEGADTEANTPMDETEQFDKSTT